MEESFIQARRASLVDISEMALSILRDYDTAVKKGDLDLATAQQSALRQIRTLRYGKEGYFWVQELRDPVSVILLHPSMPWLEGMNANDPYFEKTVAIRLGTDPKALPASNLNLFQAFTYVCRTAGSGYVSYSWPKPLAAGKVTPRPSPRSPMWCCSSPGTGSSAPGSTSTTSPAASPRCAFSPFSFWPESSWRPAWRPWA